MGNSLLSKSWEACLQRQLPAVLYHLPGASAQNILVQTDSKLHILNAGASLEEKTGFVLAPFCESPEFPTVLIQPDLTSSIEALMPEFLAQVERQPLTDTATISPSSSVILDKATYLKELGKMIEAIQNGGPQKAVFSRAMSIAAPAFNPVEAFEKLVEKYPNAFTYLAFLPGIGCWMGATPEVLALEKRTHWETVALAGTQRLNGQPLHSIEWGQKEIHEQQLVTDYIEAHLEGIDCEKNGPFTQQAGQIVHLKTTFHLPKKATYLGDRLRQLHPTPAVCGLPQQEALQLILQLEPHVREYYTGYLGPVNSPDGTALFVNLRCMKVNSNELTLFVGGGITSGSIPEKEWEETAHKAETLLAVI